MNTTDTNTDKLLNIRVFLSEILNNLHISKALKMILRVFLLPQLCQNLI